VLEEFDLKGGWFRGGCWVFDLVAFLRRAKWKSEA
jgi:hypothetical protein